MNATNQNRMARQATVITAGVILFLYFLLFCYNQELRELGPSKPSNALFVIGVLLGLSAAFVGAVDIMFHPPTDRGIGIALIAEGVVMIVLILIAWQFMGRLPLPSEELLTTISGGLRIPGIPGVLT